MLVTIIVASILCVFMAQIAIQNASQAQRLARQNVTINRLAGSVDHLSTQLARRGSISQHVTCVEDRVVAILAPVADYLDQPDAPGNRDAFHASIAKLNDAFDLTSPDACPVLPPK